jgi:hypothetical protein
VKQKNTTCMFVLYTFIFSFACTASPYWFSPLSLVLRSSLFHV